KSYSTLYVYRAAISLFSANKIGSHLLMRRFFKGVAAMRPQRSRYLYPHEGFSLKLISRKLITLLALAIAKEVNLEEIRCTAGWSESSAIFARFYNRPIVKDSSSQSVCVILSNS
ncbi:hypothetical protein ALC57_11171, partial [Trachymyrmex cornetzi]